MVGEVESDVDVGLTREEMLQQLVLRLRFYGGWFIKSFPK